MKENNRQFISSSKLFNGFTVTINLNYCDSMKDIITKFIDELLYVLKKYNFNELINKVITSKFHIHTYSFEHILLIDDIYYICDEIHTIH